MLVTVIDREDPYRAFKAIRHETWKIGAHGIITDVMQVVVCGIAALSLTFGDSYGKFFVLD